jgi:hypothetical protein
MTDVTIRQAALDDWPTIAEMGARTFMFGVDDEARMRRLCSVDFSMWVSHRGGWMGRFIDPQ